MTPQLDTIYLRNLNISAILGPDAWGRKDKLQPVILNIRLKIDTTSASTSDDIADTFSYGQMCKDITSQLDGKTFNNLQHLITVLTTFAAFWPGEDTKLQALAPKALLRVEGGLEISHAIRKKDRYEENGVPQIRHVDTRSWSIKGLKLACIIGVNKHERLDKQSVNVDLRIPATNPKNFDAKEGSSENWRTLVKRVCEVVEYSSFETLEALAARIAKTALDSFPVDEITVSVEKPSALTFVEGAGVEITRRKPSYADRRPNSSERTSETSRPRMTLDQYKRSQANDEAIPRANYPPMHHAPTMDQYQGMTRKADGSERFVDNGLASPPTLPLPQSPTPNVRRTMSAASTRTKPMTHSVSQSADSASYYVDGSVDQASPVKSHDFATSRFPAMQSPSSPRSQHSYTNGRYDYETAAGPFTPPHHGELDANANRVSDSSSMFGTLPSTTLLENVQPPFLMDETEKGVRAPGPKEMPGAYQDTPRLSKTVESGEKRDVSGTSYFHDDKELKELKELKEGKEGQEGQRDDVSIGEAF
ncbi:MAG: hypothetical protein Q9173_006334 [Seirophora scorigena]